jgi:hypothetical protein
MGFLAKRPGVSRDAAQPISTFYFLLGTAAERPPGLSPGAAASQSPRFNVPREWVVGKSGMD